jgi:Tol biopolymer transport system component
MGARASLVAALAAPAAGQVTSRVSVATGGAQANNGSFQSSISADGRYVAFQSYATNLVAGETNGTVIDIFVRDRQGGTTERASIRSDGLQGNGDSTYPSISTDGRYVAFQSLASNLVLGDTNAGSDVFVHDRQSGATERVSVDSSRTQGDGPSFGPWISADGRYIAFSSLATNLVPGDTNGSGDVFVRDRQTGTTERVSVDSSGLEGNNFSGDQFHRLSISADGRCVAFASFASNLVPGDTNAQPDIFVRDRQLGTTELVSVDTHGAPANGSSGMFGLAISADGRYVTFDSTASNIVSGDTNGNEDIFVRDRHSGTNEMASVDSSGIGGNDYSYWPSISPDGRCVAFCSNSNNLVGGDTNGAEDIFVRDRAAAGFTSLCEPGASGVRICPCSNPPRGPGRGCDNSAATGGAILSASGVAYLSMDSLVFTTSGEKPTATSILLQGTVVAPSGVTYGQGVRCVAGSLHRLFTKIASGGSITAPNFSGGDPTVSARSAAKGDVIQAGQSRWYLVFYRDPTVLGGCPATSTFNATQSGRVDWSL